MTIADLRALLEKASPGPWRAKSGPIEGWGVVAGERYVCGLTGSYSNPSTAADAALIVAAVNNLGALLEIADAAKAAREAAIKLGRCGDHAAPLEWCQTCQYALRTDAQAEEALNALDAALAKLDQ